eukprot:TRINITY_DN7626_c0_g1_i1.p1 TRINITY_DN7626_c0_g1~~TRINITY_DN7626_c0_g1_i1.p1  ORF type:complete len:609 (+),score=183.85 TRINITY_DN7626_c0_g1_i1:65-1828(+)
MLCPAAASRAPELARRAGGACRRQRRRAAAGAAPQLAGAGGFMAELRVRLREQQSAAPPAAAPAAGGLQGAAVPAFPPSATGAPTGSVADDLGGDPLPSSSGAGAVQPNALLAAAQEAAPWDSEPGAGAGDAGAGLPAASAFDPALGYRPNLLTFNHHRNLRGLLALADAPHPFQVYLDIAAHHGHQRWSEEDAMVFLAHCHIVLRVLRDAASPPPKSLNLVANWQGQAPAEEEEATGDPEAAKALHWVYEDTKRLWGALLRGGSCLGHLAATAMLRCTSVLGDADAAVCIFDGAATTDRRKRYQDVRLVNGLIWTHAEAGDMAACTSLWDLMLRYKARPDVDTYEACLHCAFRRYELPTVLQVWREMKRRRVSPRATTYEITVSGCLDTRFTNHAWMFYYKYKDAGFCPTPALQMRMGELYSDSVKHNSTRLSKVPFPVDPSPHLNYKMMIDFCRVRSIRDVVLPDHVPAPQPHYIAAVPGAETNIDTEVFAIEPRHYPMPNGRGFKVFSTHGGHPWHHAGKGRQEFLPPGAFEWQRKRKKGTPPRVKRSGYAKDAGLRAAGKVIHDFSGHKGRGPWCAQGFSGGF